LEKSINEGSPLFASSMYLIRRTEEEFRPRLAEICELRDEIVSQPVRDLWDKERRWEVLLDLHAIQRAPPADSHMAIEHITLQSTTQSKRLAIAAAALEAGMALFDMVRMYTRLALRLPRTWSMSLGAGEYNSAVILRYCKPDTPHNKSVHFIQELLCRLRQGEQGLDALKSLGNKPSAS